MNKHRKKQRQTKFWKRARAICNLHSCYNFALVLYKNALVFSQSKARNFSCTLLKWGNEEKKVVTWPEYQEVGNNIARSLSFLTYFVWQRRWNWGFLDLTLSAVRGVWPLISPKRISLESNEKVMETEEMIINWRNYWLSK